MVTRALVLGGGGPVGIAWETGLAAGLAEAGVSLGEADLIIGTSAGSVVGAQLALGRPPGQMAGALRAQGTANQRATPNATQGPPTLTGLMELMARAAASGQPRAEYLKEVGAFALFAQTAPEEEFIASFGRTLGDAGWPQCRFICTAIDALNGSFMAWDNDAGVPLARAVASSCAVPGIYPPITINGRRYYDGGLRSGTNADLARGAAFVLVISVSSGAAVPEQDSARAALAAATRERLEGELRGLREGGSDVELVTPDAASADAFGLNLMDFSRRGGALAAGLAQGQAEAARLRARWTAAAPAPPAERGA